MKNIQVIKFNVHTIQPRDTISTSNGVKIINWGEGNTYPLFLNRLYVKSPTHGGIINSKKGYIIGGGFDISEDVNRNGFAKYTLNEILENAILDLEKFNGISLLVTITNTGKIELTHIPFEKVRLTDDGRFAVYDDLSKKKCTIYDNFFDTGNTGIAYLNLTGTTQLLDEYDNVYTTHYPIPSYFSGLDAIQTEIEMNYYNLSEIRTGFHIGTIISLNDGVPASEEEANEIAYRFKSKLQDRNNWGGMVITFSDGKERAPEVHNLNGNDLVDRYNTLRSQMTDSIMVAHSVVSPALFGIKTAGQLGSTQELKVAYDIFKSQYIIPRRNIVERFFRDIYDLPFTIKDVTPAFLTE